MKDYPGRGHRHHNSLLSFICKQTDNPSDSRVDLDPYIVPKTCLNWSVSSQWIDNAIRQVCVAMFLIRIRNRIGSERSGRMQKHAEFHNTPTDYHGKVSVTDQRCCDSEFYWNLPKWRSLITSTATIDFVFSSILFVLIIVFKHSGTVWEQKGKQKGEWITEEFLSTQCRYNIDN